MISPLSGLPSAPHLILAQEEAKHLRIGPVADGLWWRAYHDEPDRGPWDTLEQCILAAVHIERRAIERHRADPSSLKFTRSTLPDLDTIERLLSKVATLAPHLQRAIEKASPNPRRFMQNTFLHPDIRAQNVMVPNLTAENAESRMEVPTLIDWQGTTILPYAMQFYTPPIVEYNPRLFREDGSPIIDFNGMPVGDEVPWPHDFEKMSPGKQEVVRAEHRVAMRHFQWNKTLFKNSNYAYTLAFSFQRTLYVLLQVVLRSVADGPQSFEYTLVNLKAA